MMFNNLHERFIISEKSGVICDDGKYTFSSEGKCCVSGDTGILESDIGVLSLKLAPVSSENENVQIYKGDFVLETNVRSQVNSFFIRFDVNCPKSGFHWIPNIKEKPEHVSGQHTFRSPAAIISGERYALALIPDLLAIEKNNYKNLYLDMRFPDSDELPYIEYGIQSVSPDGHVYYRPDGERITVEKGIIRVEFYLMVIRDMSDWEIVRNISSFQWNRFASNYIEKPLQMVPFSKYASYGNSMALTYLYRKGPNHRTGGITLTTLRDENGIYSGREYKDDIWFHSWFNNMRTAMELAHFGNEEEAYEIAECLLSSPQKNGIFYSIYAPHDGGWIASSHHGGGRDYFSLPDCSWTAIWLRRYTDKFGKREDFIGRDNNFIDRVNDFLCKYRDFICNNQSNSGGLPCWVRTNDLSHDDRLNDSAASSVSIWFLCEELLSGSIPKEEVENVTAVIVKGADFIVSEIIPRQKFEDFELYYSCSGKDLDFYDKTSEMYGQNTLSMQWCCECLRLAHIITGDTKYLENGLFCLGILSLYQQVWDNPHLNINTFGGFGVMNTDGEWNDARQAQFAETYMNYYDLTGDKEFFERAVAATRASFTLMAINENKTICPNNFEGCCFNFEIHGGCAENYAHDGSDRRSYQSGFHWGTGSALVAAAELIERYSFGG